MTLQFPDTPSSNLLWSQMMLVWCVTHYFFGRTKPAIIGESPSLFGRSLVAALASSRHLPRPRCLALPAKTAGREFFYL